MGNVQCGPTPTGDTLAPHPWPDVQLRVNETEISATLWVRETWEGLYFFY